MRKLERLKLHDDAVMNNDEMKAVVGGSYTYVGVYNYRCTIYNQEYPGVTTTVIVATNSHSEAMRLGREAFIASGYSASNPLLNTMVCG